jgi:hypothetical protein
MGGGTRVERPEEERVEEEVARLPIRITPTTARLEEQERRALQQAFERMGQDVEVLRQHSRQFRARADAATMEYVTGEADRVEQALGRMDLTALPVLGSRYADEIESINAGILLARREGTEGRLGEALNRLEEAHARLIMLRDVFGIEMRMLMVGLPADAEISGVVEGGDALDAVFDGLESAVVTVGTPNEQLGQTIIMAGQLYANNATSYSIDDENVHQESNAVLSFIVERGAQARDAEFRYTPELQASDRRALELARRNIRSMAAQARRINTETFTAWQRELTAMIASETNEQVRQQMQNLHDQIDEALSRMREGRDLSQLETNRITTTYLMLSGRVVPETEEEREERLLAVARGLRGRRARVTEGSPEWFGQQAITAMEQGERNRAALANSLGVLVQVARSRRVDPQDYLPNYRTMVRVITERRDPSPAMLSQYSNELDIAHMTMEIERLEGQVLRGRGRAKRQRIRDAARVIRERLAQGNSVGATRLLNMVLFYQDTLQRHSYRTWTGDSIVAEAIDSEMTGQDASERFNTGRLYYNITQQTDGLRESISDWRGRRIAFQRRNVEQMIDHITTLAQEGNAEQARTALTLLSMYIDSVERLGIRNARGNITRVTDENLVHLSSMESSLEALRRGETDVEEAFMQGFNASQLVYVQGEAERLAEVARARAAGRATIERALAAARQRAEQEDIRGANQLLQYVRDYYGEAGEGRREGWRYSMSTTEVGEHGIPRGYIRGRNLMIAAIDMEINADTEEEHVAAARQFDRGTRRIAQTERLISQYNIIVGVLEGREQIMEGVEAGRVPFGRRREDGTFPDHITMEEVRHYERANPSDTTLAAGRTIEQRLEPLRAAAFDGNRRHYDSVEEAFDQRFGLVAARTHRRRTVVEARGALRQARDALWESFAIYAAHTFSEGGTRDGNAVFRHFEEQYREPVYRTETRTSPSGRPIRVRVFDRYEERADLETMYTVIEGFYGRDHPNMARMRSMVQFSRYLSTALDNLEGMENSTDEVPLHHIAPFLDFARRESRRAIVYSHLADQIAATRQYIQMVIAGGADRFEYTRSRLERSQQSLEQAMRFAMEGRYDRAEQMYAQAIRHRTFALNSYEARNASTIVEYGGTLERAADEISSLLATPERWATREPDLSHYDHYQRSLTDAFHSIVTGEIVGGAIEVGGEGRPLSPRERVERSLAGARLVEASVFSIPSDAMSQVFSDRADDQQRVLALARQGRNEEALTIIREMQESVGTHQFWTAIGIGIGALVVTCFNPLLGGAIFTTMSIEQLVTEYRTTGTTTWQSWFMLGAIVATMGIAGAAGIARTAAEGARAMELTAHAARMTSISRGLTYAGLGIGVGFSGYIGYHAYEQFREGRSARGVALLAMALFPWAVMGAAPRVRAWRIARAERAQARQQMEAMMEQIRLLETGEARLRVETPSETPSLRAARELQTPEEMFRFLRELRSEDAVVRQSAESRLRTLPEEMIPVVRQLMNGRIGNLEFMQLRQALESATGELTPYARAQLTEALQQMEVGPRPEPTPPRGPPRGGRPVPRGEVEGAGLFNPGRLFDLLRDLSIPESATVGETALAREAFVRRSAARTTLERIRVENPQAAEVIDGLVRNPTVRDYVSRGTTADPQVVDLGQRLIDWAVEGRTVRRPDGTTHRTPGLRELMRPEVVEAEAAVAVRYYQEAVGAEGFRPRAVRPGEVAEVPGRPRTRAMADEGGAGEGPTEPGRPPTFEELSGGRAEIPVERGPVEPRAPRREAPRRAERPVPEEAAAEGEVAAAEGERPVTPREMMEAMQRQQQRRGLFGRLSGRIGRLWEGRQAARQAREEAIRNPEYPVAEETPASLRRAVEERLDTTASREARDLARSEARETVREADAEVALLTEEGAPPEQIRTATRRAEALRAEARELEAALDSAPESAFEILRALYRFSQEGGGTAASALAHRIYARPNVRAQLEVMAGREGLFRRAVGRETASRLRGSIEREIQRGARRAGRETVGDREAGIPVEEYLRNLADRPIRDGDVELIVRALEATRGRRPLLTRSEEVLGIRFSSQERAYLIDSLYRATAELRAARAHVRRPLVTPRELISEAGRISERFGRGVDRLPTEGQQAVADIQATLKQRARTPRAEGEPVGMENALAEIIRSNPEIYSEVHRVYGEEAAGRFLEATTLDEVLATLRVEGQPMPELLSAVEGFVGSARSSGIATDFAAMRYLATNQDALFFDADTGAVGSAVEARDVAPEVRSWFGRALHFVNVVDPIFGGRWGFRNFFRRTVGWPARQPGQPWYALRGRSWDPGLLTGGSARRWARSLPGMAGHAALWYWVFGPATMDSWEWLVEVATGARTAAEGRALARRLRGVDISEENAEWIMGGRTSEEAGLMREVRDRFTELRSDVLTLGTGRDEIGRTLSAQRGRELNTLILAAEEAVLRQISTEAYNEETHGREIRNAFDTLRRNFETAFEHSLDANQREAVLGEFNSAMEDIIDEFEDSLTGEHRESRGMDFLTQIPRFPRSSQFRPRSEQQMRAALADQQVLIDIRRIDDVLDDGREMDRELDDLNGYIRDLRTARTETDRQTARDNISGIVDDWGITLEVLQPFIRNARRRRAATTVGDAFVAYLQEQRGRDELNIADLYAMRRTQWRERGLALSFSDAVAIAFLIDNGVVPTPLMMSRMSVTERTREEAEARVLVRFLSSNPTMFRSLWEAVQQGNVPSVFLDDAITALRQREASEESLDLNDAAMMGFLRGNNLWIESVEPAARGREATRRGMRPLSFLGLLNTRAALEPAFRETYQRILTTYRVESTHTGDERARREAALRAFNSFSLQPVTVDDEGRVTGGETIYGDAEALASLIEEVSRLRTEDTNLRGERARRGTTEERRTEIDTRLTAVRARLIELGAIRATEGQPDQVVELADLARQRGFIGPAILGYLEPRLLDPANAHLVQLVLARSDLERDLGMMRWLRVRDQNIRGRVLDVLREEARPTSSIPGAGRPNDVYRYLEDRAEYYRQLGIWMGPTPAQEAEARERRETRRREAETIRWEEEFRQRPPVLRGVPRRAEEAPEEAEEAPAPAEGAEAERAEQMGALPEAAQRFYQDQNSEGEAAQRGGVRFARFIDRVTTSLIESRAEDGSLTPDATTMQQAFGEDINSTDEATRTAARQRVRQVVLRNIWEFLHTRSGRRRATTTWGLAVSGSEDELTVQIGGRGAASRGLTSHILERIAGRRAGPSEGGESGSARAGRRGRSGRRRGRR